MASLDSADSEQNCIRGAHDLVLLSGHDKLVSSVLKEIAKNKGCELLQVALTHCQQRVPYVFPLVGIRCSNGWRR